MPVTYIPSQLEAPPSTAAPALTLRASPSWLLFSDLKQALKLAKLIPHIFLPLPRGRHR